MKQLKKIGCKMGIINNNLIAYADDIAVMAPSITSLKKLLDICLMKQIDYF